MSATIIHPEGWKPAKGYANAMLAEGRVLVLGGQIGWTADQVFEHHDFAGQFRQTLLNIRALVEAAGGTVEHIVRMTWFVTDKQAYLADPKGMGAIYREVMGRHFPTMSVVFVTELVEDAALLEIEATAVLPLEVEP